MPIIRKKRGVSVMVGYILLISLGMVMAIMVYGYIKTYTPSDPLECPSGTSLMLKNYDCIEGDQLNLTIKNNGKFSLEGMMILATTEPDQEIATTDLTNYLNNDLGDGPDAIALEGFIGFSMDGSEKMKANEELSYVFDLNNSGPYYEIEIIPLRFQKEGETQRYTLCGDGKTREDLYCSS